MTMNNEQTKKEPWRLLIPLNEHLRLPYLRNIETDQSIDHIKTYLEVTIMGAQSTGLSVHSEL